MRGEVRVRVDDVARVGGAVEVDGGGTREARALDVDLGPDRPARRIERRDRRRRAAASAGDLEVGGAEPVPSGVVTAIRPVEAPVGTLAVMSVSELTT